MKGVSRQRLWQLRMRAEGRCPKCGGERDAETVHCSTCNAKMNELGRRAMAERAATERRRRML